MTYDQLIAHTFQQHNVDLVAVNNCYDVPYDHEHGWPLKLPDVNFGERTFLLLHFQDFVTPGESIKELAKVEAKYSDCCDRVVVTYWSHELDHYYHGPINLIELSSHNLITCESLAARQQEWLHYFDSPRQWAWQCLNGRECSHRQRVFDMLSTWPGGVLSYGQKHLLEHWNYTTYRGTENDENFVRLASLYSQCAVNIITETQYDSRPGIVSEKTLQAFAAGQVPIVIGHPGIVQDCRDLGFDMFDDVVDTSYDWLPNHERAERALELNQGLILGRRDLSDLQPRLLQQRQRVLQEFPQWIRSNFVQQVSRLIGGIYPF